MKKWLPLSLLILVFSMYGMDSIQSSALTLSKEPYPSTDFFPFDELPNDIIGEIFSFLQKKDWFNTFLVSKKFNRALTETLERKFEGKEQFEQFKHHELLSQKKLYLNHLKKIATYWLKKNKQPKFRELWHNPFLTHAYNMNEESALNIISTFIQFAPKCGLKNFWVIYRGNKLYTSDVAKKEMENYLTYYPKDLSNLLIWHFIIGANEISFSKNKH